jgi:hypothetical protein
MQIVKEYISAKDNSDTFKNSGLKALCWKRLEWVLVFKMMMTQATLAVTCGA